MIHASNNISFTKMTAHREQQMSSHTILNATNNSQISKSCNMIDSSNEERVMSPQKELMQVIPNNHLRYTQKKDEIAATEEIEQNSFVPKRNGIKQMSPRFIAPSNDTFPSPQRQQQYQQQYQSSPNDTFPSPQRQQQYQSSPRDIISQQQKAYQQDSLISLQQQFSVKIIQDYYHKLDKMAQKQNEMMSQKAQDLQTQLNEKKEEVDANKRIIHDQAKKIMTERKKRKDHIKIIKELKKKDSSPSSRQMSPQTSSKFGLFSNFICNGNTAADDFEEVSTPSVKVSHESKVPNESPVTLFSSSKISFKQFANQSTISYQGVKFIQKSIDILDKKPVHYEFFSNFTDKKDPVPSSYTFSKLTKDSLSIDNLSKCIIPHFVVQQNDICYYLFKKLVKDPQLVSGDITSSEDLNTLVINIIDMLFKKLSCKSVGSSIIFILHTCFPMCEQMNTNIYKIYSKYLKCLSNNDNFCMVISNTIFSVDEFKNTENSIDRAMKNNIYMLSVVEKLYLFSIAAFGCFIIVHGKSSSTSSDHIQIKKTLSYLCLEYYSTYYISFAKMTESTKRTPTKAFQESIINISNFLIEKIDSICDYDDCLASIIEIDSSYINEMKYMSGDLLRDRVSLEICSVNGCKFAEYIHYKFKEAQKKKSCHTSKMFVKNESKISSMQDDSLPQKVDVKLMTSCPRSNGPSLKQRKQDQSPPPQQSKEISPIREFSDESSIRAPKISKNKSPGRLGNSSRKF